MQARATYTGAISRWLGVVRFVERALTYRFLYWWSIATSFVMSVVLLQGTLVTNTGSQAGCGDTWPLCRGAIIPELSGVSGAATTIEFSHRVVVPLVSTMIVVLSAGVWLHWRRRFEAVVLVPAMLFFLLLQAVLGGLAVMYPTSPTVLALHFGISLLAFSSVVLSTAFVVEMDRAETLRRRGLSRGLLVVSWCTVGWSFIQVYLGAYVRHTGASLACPDWPLCRGTVIPPLDQYVVAQLGHRFGAVVLTLLIAAVWSVARASRRSRPDLYHASRLAMSLVVLQVLSGGLVVFSQLAVLSTLLHSFLAALLFATLCYLCYHTLPVQSSVHSALEVATH